MMKKFSLFLGLVVMLSLVLAACGPAATLEPAVEEPAAEEPAAEEPAAEEPAAEPFRGAVVMPSAINDLAFSQSMYDALLRVQTEMGGEGNFEIVYSENMFVVDDA